VDIRRWPSELLLASVLLLGALAGGALAAYPDALRTPGARVLPVFLGIVLVGYATVGVWSLVRPSGGAVWGAGFGAVAGLLWFAEILGGGPILLGRAAEQINGAIFSLAAVAVTVAAGVLGGTRGVKRGAFTSGLFAGLVSGAVVFALAVPMTLLYLDRLGARPDYQHQLARSGAPSMSAFLVQDALSGYGAHLVLNPVLGLVGAGIGALIARAAHGRPEAPAATEWLSQKSR
jgi:hypothetical protein